LIQQEIQESQSAFDQKNKAIRQEEAQIKELHS